MSLRIRLLPFATGDGSSNMAADEALLASALDGTASFRCYGWSCATLSLGYFQRAAPALAYPGLAGLPWIRRPTGGSALVHHQELTYALALPAGTAWQPRTGNWGCRFHELIRAVLAGLGIETHLCQQEQKKSDVLCFLHHTPGDLLLGSCKVAGSAQRKRRGALLQHGGILLAQSSFTPELPGIAELSGIRLSASTLQDGLVAALNCASGWQVEQDDWTARERQFIDDALSRYGSADWNNRR
jgi:lipoate-protein ligase A